MAIVMDFISRNGAHVIVRDDCYRDCTPEEIERRRAEVVRAMEFIALRNAQLAAEAQRKKREGRGYEDHHSEHPPSALE